MGKNLRCGGRVRIDTDEAKLAVATKTGATETFCVKDENYLSRFHEITYDKGVDIVFESSGNAAGIGSSLLLAAKGGAVVLLGIPYGDVALPRLNFEKIVRNELKSHWFLELLDHNILSARTTAKAFA